MGLSVFLPSRLATIFASYLSIDSHCLVESKPGKKSHKNSSSHLNLVDYKRMPGTLLSLVD